jgi:hypothetical protein
MKELSEYRTRLIDRLVAASREFRDACLAVKDPFAPLEDGGWNVHRIAAHTRDVDKLVYGLRAQRTADEENPEFQNFDGEAYMETNYDSAEPLDEMLDGFVKSVEALADRLRGLPVEAWSRESRHVMLGSGITLQAWVERDLAHIEEHLDAVKKGS